MFLKFIYTLPYLRMRRIELWLKFCDLSADSNLDVFKFITPATDDGFESFRSF